MTSLIIRVFFILLILVACSKNQVNQVIQKPVVKGRGVGFKVPVDPSPKKANGLLTDATKLYGLESKLSVKNYIVDFNNDGYFDLVSLPEFYDRPHFYQFDKTSKKFKLINYSPFPEMLRASYLIWSDFDKDGVIDVIVGTLVQRSRLALEKLRMFQGQLKSGKIAFQEKEGIGLPPLPAGSVSLIDFDLDGLLDIFIANWIDQSKGEKVKLVRDYLLKATEPFKFRDESYRLNGELRKEKGQLITIKPSIGSSTCDIDKNGWPDILTTSTHGYANKLWLNRLNKKTGNEFSNFAKSSHYAGDDAGVLDLAGNGSTFHSACTDYNDDGIIDVFLGEQTHSYDSDKRDRSSLLTGYSLKFPPLFFRSPYINENDKNWNQSDRRGIWLDIDNDGLLDLLVENSGFPPKTRLITFLQNPDYSFKEYSDKSGADIVNPSGVVNVDLNGDGKEDLIVGQTNVRDGNIPQRVWVFENKNKLQARGVRLFLRGKKSNSFGLGSLLIAKTNRRVITRFVEFSRGSLPSSNAMYTTISLQPGEKISYLDVKWPHKTLEKPVRYWFKKTDKLSEYTLCESGKKKRGRRRKCP